jgi:DNA polymerase III psi subunit
VAATGLTATLGATGGLIVGGALAGAAGSVISQAVGIAAGIQSKFSFKGVALAALGGAVGGAFKGFNVFAKMGIGGNVAGSQFLGNVARGAVGSAINQGTAVVTGLQSKFDWAGVAAAGASAGVAGAFRVEGISKINRSIPAYASNAGVNMASAIANGATRSLINGSDFGDNIMAALPDIIAQTVGGMLINGVGDEIDRRVNIATENMTEDNPLTKRQVKMLVKFAISIDQNDKQVAHLLNDEDTQDWIISEDRTLAPTGKALHRETKGLANDLNAAIDDARWRRYYDDVRDRQTGGVDVVVGPFAIQGASKEIREAYSWYLSAVLGTDRGKQFRAAAESTSRQERIVLSTKSHNHGNIRLGVVHININQNSITETDKGRRPSTPLGSLAHELGHVVFGTLDDGPNRMNNVKLNENPVRLQLGLRPRKKY